MQHPLTPPPVPPFIPYICAPFSCSCCAPCPLLQLQLMITSLLLLWLLLLLMRITSIKLAIAASLSLALTGPKTTAVCPAATAAITSQPATSNQQQQQQPPQQQQTAAKSCGKRAATFAFGLATTLCKELHTQQIAWQYIKYICYIYSGTMRAIKFS